MSNDINTTEAGPSSTQSKKEHVIFLAIEISKSASRGGQNKKKKITEIGISTLATSDLLIGRARGETHVEMDRFKERIRTRNFIIKEWSNLQETDLVQGYGDTFKKELGSSECISVHSAPKLIASCFGHEVSSNPAITPRLGGSSSSSSASIDDNNNKSFPQPTSKSDRGVIVPEEGKKCDTVIVVGHRVEKKISDLKDIIGYDVTKLGNVIKAIDVQDMFRALQQNPKTRTLYSILQELDKPIQSNANPVSFFLLVARTQGKKRRKNTGCHDLVCSDGGKVGHCVRRPPAMTIRYRGPISPNTSTVWACVRRSTWPVMVHCLRPSFPFFSPCTPVHLPTLIFMQRVKPNQTLHFPLSRTSPLLYPLFFLPVFLRSWLLLDI